MITGSIARRYAKALLEIGIAQQTYDALGKEVDQAVVVSAGKRGGAHRWTSRAGETAKAVRPSANCMMTASVM